MDLKIRLFKDDCKQLVEVVDIEPVRASALFRKGKAIKTGFLNGEKYVYVKLRKLTGGGSFHCQMGDKGGWFHTSVVKFLE